MYGWDLSRRVELVPAEVELEGEAVKHLVNGGLVGARGAGGAPALLGLSARHEKQKRFSHVGARSNRIGADGACAVDHRPAGQQRRCRLFYDLGDLRRAVQGA